MKPLVPVKSLASVKSLVNDARLLIFDARRQGRLGPLAPFVHNFPPRVPQPRKRMVMIKQSPTTDVEAVLVTDTRCEAMLEEYLEVCAQFDQLQAKKKLMNDELKGKWHAKLGPKFETEEILSTEVQSSNSHISSEILVKLGVSPIKIEKATVRTPYSYVKVTRKKTVLVSPLRDAVRKVRREHGIGKGRKRDVGIYNPSAEKRAK